MMKQIKLSQKNYPISKKSKSSNNIFDKQNIHSFINQQNKSNHIIQKNITINKTGIQIRNKIKNNNKEKHKETLNTNLPTRKNSFFNSKLYKKNLKQKQYNGQNSCNLSTTSSTKSIKSVTFSVDFDPTQSLSSSKHRKNSILKNKINLNKHLNQSEKKSIASSYCSHVKSLDQSVQSPNSNSIILQKYQKIIRQIRLTNQKYTDSIYPPCEQSIFLKTQFTKDFIYKLSQDGYRIKWIRISQLFKDKKICVWNPQSKTIITKGFINLTSHKDYFMQNVFNSINKKNLMQKIFQSQQICNQGIYYVKMHQTQTNTWKYVVLDDYIPVIMGKSLNNQQKIIKPAFLNINIDYLQKQDIIQIWPFLLQKAYAKYYSTYDTLLSGNTLNFLQQVTGNFYKSFCLKQLNQQNNSKINQILNNRYNITIGQTQNGILYPFKTGQQTVQIIDIQNQINPIHQIPKQELMTIFTKIHIIQTSKYIYEKNCLIKQQNLLEKQINDNKKSFILRNFTINQSTQCHIGLIQKQQRFHRGKINIKTNKKVYQYSWIRLLLVMKQPNGYRWIQSAYSNDKSIKLQASLEAGQYFIIIIPEWTNKPNNLNLSLLTNAQTIIERKSYQNHLNIIEQSAMDLAQRSGKLIQINPNICAYNFIDYKIGFIIQNINNQKSNGEVKILRTIQGLQDYNIVPINQQFYKNKKLQIKIKSLQSYTVVLKVLGGVDKVFLQQFDFGS